MIVKLIVNEWLEFHGVHFFVPGAAEQPKAISKFFFSLPFSLPKITISGYIGNDRIPFVPDNKDKRKLVLKYRDIFYEIEFQSRDEVVLFRGPY